MCPTGGGIPVASFYTLNVSKTNGLSETRESLSLSARAKFRISGSLILVTLYTVLNKSRFFCECSFY